MQKITTFLTYNSQAEEAMNFYTSVFKNSKIVSVMRNGGMFFGGTFELEGQRFFALNGGPTFSFSLGISLFVNCPTQEEIDYYWEKLSEGGRKDRCGWLQDKFGVAWQIVPPILGELP
jgi:predicted 3-demethylubiquinone-9 3-methyltransferase (glyoxalase superfamily)